MEEVNKAKDRIKIRLEQAEFATSPEYFKKLVTSAVLDKVGDSEENIASDLRLLAHIETFLDQKMEEEK